MIEAVIFDFDGLMIDTETASYLSFCDVYREYGAALPPEMYAKCVGTTYAAFNPYRYLEECIGQTLDHTAVKSRFDAIHTARLANAEPRPGVVDYLQTAKSLNLKIGLATSSPFAWIEPYFEKFGWAPYFDSVCTADNVKNVKPDPALYLLSLKNLNVSGRQTISFEDSLHGFHAAKQAGLNTVIVPNEFTRSFAFSDYDLLIPSMDEMDLREVIAHISEKNAPSVEH